MQSSLSPFCRKTGLWITALILLSSTQVRSSHAVDLNLFHFRLAGVGMLQNSGTLLTGSLSWNPLISFQTLDTSMMDLFGLRLHLGAIGIKNQASEYSVAVDYQALWVTRLKAVAFEVGPGVQNFVGQGGSRFTLNTNFDIDFGLLRGLWKGFRQLVVGYSALLDTTYFTHQVRLGIGIQL